MSPMPSTDETGFLCRKRQRLTDMLIKTERELLTAEVEQQVLSRLDGHSNTNVDEQVIRLRVKMVVCREMLDIVPEPPPEPPPEPKMYRFRGRPGS